MWLIVGLGNPGSRYEWTPHNLGFRVLDSLAASAAQSPGMPKVERRFADYFRRFDLERLTATRMYVGRAIVAKRMIANQQVLLAKPMTYMNESGRSVSNLLLKLKWPVSNVIVVVDDIALPWGYVRVRGKGSAGGHKGLASIITALGTDAFARVRMGVGLENRSGDLSDYVLNPVPKSWRPFVTRFADETAAVVETIVTEGVEWGMAKFNKKVPLVSWETSV